ncbi:MAG: DUF2911 domain-containing protein [Thermoanaerobaculia bacterium]
MSTPVSRLSRRFVPALALAALVVPATAFGQGLTLPPDGDNERSTTTQQIGLVNVTVDYHSPDVHAPDGSDRRGKIWGDLVAWGMHQEAFGTCGSDCPWRGGANENTTLEVNYDVKVQGQPLPAGRYGLHFIPGKDEWTVVFSKNSTSWGSFFYDAQEDQLRVTAKPVKNEYREYLTYEFTVRKPTAATLALEWEDLALPIEISVDDMDELYIASIRRELRSNKGFDWQAWVQASAFCADKKKNLPEALAWAQYAVNPGNFIGEVNFRTLSNLARLQEANGKLVEAQASMDKAIHDPTATALDLHQWGRRLLADKRPADALKVFQLNAERNHGAWPTEVGLARGYSAVGNYKEALKHAKAALAQAPDDTNKKFLAKAVELLGQGKDIN